MSTKKIRRVGKVISDTPEKTIIVAVSWSQHDPNEEAKVGDNVIVEFSKPISKTKKWKLVEVVI